MKKLLVLLLALVMCMSFVTACTLGGGGGEGGEGGEGGATTSAQDALAYATAMYSGKYVEGTVTASSYDIIGKAPGKEGVFHDIVWTTDSAEITVSYNDDHTKATITLPDEPAADIIYTLTATVTDGEETVSESFGPLKVPKFAVNTFAQYAAAEDNTSLVIEGIVSGIVSKSTGSTVNGVYIQDLAGEGGYYVYDLANDPLTAEGGNLAVGMKVQAKGLKKLYNGTYELVDASIKVLDTAITALTPVDYTQIFINAADTKAAELVGKQGLLVTLKGVTVKDAGDNGYYNFSLGGKDSYLRISSSNNPTDKDSLDAIKAAFGANYGNIADVTGLITLYNGAFYLMPVSADAYSNFQQPDRDDQQKAQFEIDALKVVANINADGSITLAVVGATYEEVTIAWTSNSANAVVGDAGVITFTVPDEDAEVVLTATATCGDKTASKEFTIKLSKSIISAAEANKIGAAQDHNTYTEGKYLVAGIITEIKNDTYGNLYIRDEHGDLFYIYGLYDAAGKRYDAMEAKPAVGDYLVVLTILGQYNGTAQGKNATIVSFTAGTAGAAFNEIAAAQDHNTYTEDKYLVIGVVTEVKNATYGNLYVQTADGASVYVYGLYDQQGVRYDKLANAPQVGDAIAIYGAAGQYNGAAQMKNATLVCWEQKPATDDGEGGEGNEGGEGGEEGGEETLPSTITSAAEANKIGAAQADNVYTADKYLVAGIITEIKNTTYGNLYIRDEHGDTFYIYGLYDAAGARYDAMEVKPAVGDYIVVLTALGQYKTAPQGKDAVLVLHETADKGADFNAAGAAQADNTATEDAYLIIGVVTEIKNTTYGNLYVQTADGASVYVYGLYDQQNVRYDKLANAPQVGDAVAVYGPASQYKGAAQMKDGILVCWEKKPATDDGEGGEGTEEGGSTESGTAYNPVVGNTANIVIADLADASKWENSKLYDSIVIDGYVTIATSGTAGDYGLNTGKYYTNGENWRIYQADKPSVVITAAEGKKIATVKISYASQNTGVLTLDGANVESDQVVTVNGTTVTFSVGNTGTVTNGQARITAIEIIFAEE